LPPNLRIRGHLPAAIINWGVTNGQISDFKARDLDLNRESGHTAYHHASLVDLYLHTKFHGNRRNFLWTDGRAHRRADGHLRPTLLGRLGGFDLKIQPDQI